MIQYRVKRNVIFVFAIASCCLILVSEFFVYSVHRWGWPKLTCRSDKCLRVLFVADPQLIGETLDTNFYNGLSIYDSDRYLRKTFVQAMHHARPDVICFMGDLMDEGSIADDQAFERYRKRFQHIYDVHGPVQNIYIPGDNDVGGEGADHVSAFKVNRFHEAFNDTAITMVRDRFRFLHVNLMTRTYPEPDNMNSSDSVNIVLSHISILSYPGLTMKSILDNLKPSIIFTAHMHLSRLFYYPEQTAENVFDNRRIVIDLTHQDGNDLRFAEIMIPTASYRMGVKNIGHGFAIIDDDQVQYTVLWSPDRFRYLWIYITWLGMFIAAALVWGIYRHLPICKRRVSYRFRLMIDTNKF